MKTRCVLINNERKLVHINLIGNNFNNSLSCSTFPTGKKYSDVTPIHKKDDKTDKTNYRPISVLPNLSKVNERLMYNQIFPYFDSVFPNYSVDFGKVLMRNIAS